MQAQITDVKTLEVGDTVAVSGNGVDIEREVVDTYEDAWTGRWTARLAGTDFAYMLTSESHPLKSDGCTLTGIGAVTVERVN